MKKYLLWFDVVFIFILLIMFAGVITRYHRMRRELSTQKTMIRNVIVANTQVINEIGKAHQQLSSTTDMILRYNHYLDKHDPTTESIQFCPECSVSVEKEDVLVTHSEEQLEEIPETVEQLKKDTKEIYNGVHTVNNSVWSQTILLKSVLEKLREARNER